MTVERRHPLRFTGPTAALVAVVLLVVIPLLQLLRIGTQEASAVGGAWDAITSDGSLSNTLWLGLTVAVLGSAGGALAAFITERALAGGGRWIQLGVLIPFLIPGFVSALSFIRTYGPGGLVDDLTGHELPGLFGPFGVVIVLAINAAPIAYLVVVAALRSRVEPDLERAARIHGAGPAATWITVTAPLLAPALAAGMALVFVSAINAFGVPAFLGTPAGFTTVTTAIYRDLALAARPEAFSRAVLLAIVLVTVALGFVLVADRVLAGMGAAVRTGMPGGVRGGAPRKRRGLTALMLAVVGLATVLPFAVLVLTAFTRAVGLAPVPRNLTTANFEEALQGSFAGAFGRSILLAGLAATVVLGLGALVAALRHGRLQRSLKSAILLTFAVPGSTLAVAVLVTYGATLRDTLAIIAVAYVAKLWGVGHRVLAGSAGSLPPDLYRAARTSGASPMTAVTTVVIPLLRPALLGGWMIVFVISFHELTMSSLLYGPGTDTLAVVVLNLQQLGDVTVSAAVAVLLTIPVLLIAAPLLFSRLSGSARA